MIGSWKNIQDLEESLCLDELEAVVRAAREREHRNHKFLAALKGVDIDEDKKESPKDRVEEMKKKIAARRAGKTPEQLELEDFGIGFEK